MIQRQKKPIFITPENHETNLQNNISVIVPQYVIQQAPPKKRIYKKKICKSCKSDNNKEGISMKAKEDYQQAMKIYGQGTRPELAIPPISSIKTDKALNAVTRMLVDTMRPAPQTEFYRGNLVTEPLKSPDLATIPETVRPLDIPEIINKLFELLLIPIDKILLKKELIVDDFINISSFYKLNIIQIKKLIKEEKINYLKAFIMLKYPKETEETKKKLLYLYSDILDYIDKNLKYNLPIDMEEINSLTSETEDETKQLIAINNEPNLFYQTFYTEGRLTPIKNRPFKADLREMILRVNFAQKLNKSLDTYNKNQLGRIFEDEYQTDSSYEPSTEDTYVETFSNQKIKIPNIERILTTTEANTEGGSKNTRPPPIDTLTPPTETYIPTTILPPPRPPPIRTDINSNDPELETQSLMPSAPEGLPPASEEPYCVEGGARRNCREYPNNNEAIIARDITNQTYIAKDNRKRKIGLALYDNANSTDNVAIYKENNNIIYFGSRGSTAIWDTGVTQWNDDWLLNDAAIVVGGNTENASPRIREEINLLKSIITNNTTIIITVGHSLGGFASLELLVFLAQNYPNISPFSIVFNSGSGLKAFFEKYNWNFQWIKKHVLKFHVSGDPLSFMGSDFGTFVTVPNTVGFAHSMPNFERFDFEPYAGFIEAGLRYESPPFTDTIIPEQIQETTQRRPMQEPTPPTQQEPTQEPYRTPIGGVAGAVIGGSLGALASGGNPAIAGGTGAVGFLAGNALENAVRSLPAIAPTPPRPIYVPPPQTTPLNPLLFGGGFNTRGKKIRIPFP